MRNSVKSSVTNLAMALGLVALGIAIGATGIYIGDTDDAPGAAVIGLLLMIGAVALGVKTARRKTHPLRFDGGHGASTGDGNDGDRTTKTNQPTPKQNRD